VGYVDQHVDAGQIQVVDDGAHIEVAQPEVGDNAKIADRLAFLFVLVLVLHRLLTEIVHDVSRYRPVAGSRRVGQEDLYVLATHSGDHEDFFDEAYETERACVAGQSPQLDDQLVQIVGEVLAQGLHKGLAILPIGGKHEIDL